MITQRTQPKLKEDTAVYPVIVYIHSGDFSSGTSQAQPGHVLTLQNVVVVTFNYRLGALGKLLSAYWMINFCLLTVDFHAVSLECYNGIPQNVTF